MKEKEEEGEREEMVGRNRRRCPERVEKIVVVSRECEHITYRYR